MIDKNLEVRITRLEKLLSVKNESKQVGTLYHVCTIDDYLRYILPNDTLSTSGNYKNFLYGGNDYVSFTRDRHFVVSTNKVDAANILIRLVVDGDKLSERYRIGPYNDFAYNVKFGEFDPSNDEPEFREKEEVVKGPIKSISKYIIKIDFDLNKINKDAVAILKDALENHGSKLTNITYNHFISYNNPTYSRLLKESGVRKGMSFAEAVPLFENAIDNDIERLLFSNNINLVRKAIKLLNADLNKHYTHGYPIVFYANKPDGNEILGLLLKNGADINIANSVKYSAPLNLAASAGCIANLKALLEYGADVNTHDKGSGWTPLMSAAFSGKANTVKYLISEGADVNYTDNSNNSALSLAKDSEIQDMLKAAGAV
jgi:hypothetical protein